MSLAELADLANQIDISDSHELIPTDGLWTSRNPIFHPPSPIPGQLDVPIPTDPSSLSLPRESVGLCANESGDIYLYGGVIGGRSDQLYHYSITDNIVTPLQCWGAYPGKRFSHAMAVIGNVIAIHGGNTLGRGPDPDLYLLNLVSRKWSRITATDHAPGHLVRHAMAVVGTTIYVFGGAETSRNYANSNKLWAFDLDTLRTAEPTWELVGPFSQAQPTARCESTLVSYHDRLILFGGRGFRPMSDVWSFDTKSKEWSALQCTGDIPPSYALHAAAILDDVMYIIGGYEHLSRSEFGDVFALKIPEQQWFKLETATTPVPRSDHASTCISTNIFTFGGNLVGETEEYQIRILDAKYINNFNLHTPERLMELDIWERWKRKKIVTHVLQDPSRMGSLAHLQRVDAQMIVDFLADELGRQDIIQSNSSRRHFLHLLSKLAKSAQVFPKCTELSNVQCILTNPVNGEGGYGFIYKGIFRDQAVCVKAVRVVGYDSKPSRMLRAQAGEVVLLAHVSHPNVIPLYGAYLSKEEIPRICIVSPWMENGDLVTYLGKFPDTPKILFVFDVAVGLNFLHDMGIVHADLKASNVLVSQSRRAMLADFGVSTVLHTNVGTTTAGDFAGTIYWMAPELLVIDESSDDHHPPPTKESDMWGFACICYEVLTGEIPFIRHYKPMRLAMAFMKGHKITPLRPTRDSGPIIADGGSLVTLAERCWNHDPDLRPTAAEALQFFSELDVQDDRPSADEELASFEAVKSSRVRVNIDYNRVLAIAQNN